MRFFGSDASRRFPVTTRADIGWKGNEPRIVWSPVVEGDTIGVEVVLRSREALSTFSFRIEAISHGTTPQSSIREQSGTSASRLTCSNHIDAQCRFNYSPVGGNNAVNAVARLRYEKGGFSYSCSGTLIVDGDTSNYVPYLLTAHHCIATQEVANTVVASWFYQYESCGSTAIDRRHADTTGGADLLATNPNQDSTLLRFRRRISGEQIFSGWTTQNWPGQWNHGFHHPRGGVKKFSAGRMTKRDSAEVCDDPEKSEDCITVSNAIEVDILPNRGTSEPGSSGSGLFLSRTDHTDYLMGVLSGSRGSCTDRIVSYGSFRHFFPQISRWIDTNPGPPWTPIGEDDDHGDTLAEATRVSVPSLTGGNIEHVGDYDYFLVDLTDRSADVRVNLRVHTTGPTDTYGTLFDSAGTALGTNNDGGLDNNFLIERQVQAGTYYVEVRGYDDATGGYMLETAISRDEDDHGNIPGEGTLVSIPSTTLGRLDPPGDVDYFRIEPQQDGMLQVETTGGIDTLGQLVGSGVDIEDDNSGAGDNFRFVAEVRAAATYILAVQGPFGSTEVGDYRLHVKFLGAPVPDRVLPLITAAGGQLEGFVRIINRSDRAGAVDIYAVDDTGRRFGPVSLAIGAKETKHFNSTDLEHGNARKGLSGGVGDGDGDWRLELSTALDIEPLVYSRTTDGFVTGMHDVVAQSGGSRHHVPFFNPGSNRSQVSRLRLVNPSDADARVELYGVDDAGERSGDVSIEVPAGGARTVGAQELESGGQGLSGRLGEGAGKWQLFVSADRSVQLVNLLRSPTGHLANLSTSPDVHHWGGDTDDETKLSAGIRHTCGIRSDTGAVECWGSDFYGQATPPGRFGSVSAGGVHTCGIRSDTGAVECWGADSDGQSTPPAGSFVSVSAGLLHACGIRSDTDAVECWGHDLHGQSTPPAGSFVSVSAGAWHTCAIRSYTGAVECWGIDGSGQSTPPAGRFVSVSAGGGGHTCGIRSDTGAVECWGYDHKGQSTPPAGEFVSVSAGDVHTCGIFYYILDDSGDDFTEVKCWGSDDQGQSTPPAGEFVSVSAGRWHTCGIRSDTGAVECWGLDGGGQATPPAGSFVSVSAGGDHTCGIRRGTGAVECWGSDAYGQSTPPAATHTLPLVAPASEAGLQGFVRIINHSDRAGTVEVRAIDDTGRRFGPVSLAIGAKETKHFNSTDLEHGNARKGLSGGVGDGDGDWRLELSTALDIEPLVYSRTTDGFVTGMHDVVAQSGGSRHHVPFFNPGSNRSQVSRLRLVNPSDADARVELYGVDDAGERSGDVSIEVPAGGARTVGAQELESGGQGLSGRLGEGAGKWQLFVSADRSVQLVNLLRSPTGHLANLSTSPAVHHWGGDTGAETKLSAGGRHTCAIRSDTGAVECWGSDAHGQSTPPAGEFVSVSAAGRGGAHTCAIRSDTGAVECWGLDIGGQATPPAGEFVSVSAGGAHTCGIRSDTGAVECWGYDESGQSTPPAGSFLSVSAGGDYTCGIRSDTVAVECWGEDDFGKSTPPAGRFVSVSAGGDHTCAIRRDTVAVECWGHDFHGQSTPPAGRFVSVSAGGEHTCAIRSDTGAVECWGHAYFGQSTSPAGRFVSVSAGGLHTCGIRSDTGAVECWGSDSDGQSTPPGAETLRPMGSNGTTLSAGLYHTCAIRSDTGAVECWGADAFGQSTPPAGEFVSVSAGGGHTCGILRDTGAVECWGADASGQSVPPAGEFVSVSAGTEHTCGIRSDTGAVECWGRDDFGQSTPPAGSFVSVSAGFLYTCGIRNDTGAAECWGAAPTPPAGEFVSVSLGGGHNCGILRDTGAVECWGLDADGRSTPPAGRFVSVSAGRWHTCGLRDTGAVECWGYDRDGQSTPPAGRFVSVSAGGWHTCGLRDTGAVECWGLDVDGQSTPP